MTEAVVYMAFFAVIRHLGLKLTLIYQSKRKVRMKKALIGQNGTSTTISKVLTAFKINGHGSRISFTRYLNHF